MHIRWFNALSYSMNVTLYYYHQQDNPANLDKVLTKQAEELFDNKR